MIAVALTVLLGLLQQMRSRDIVMIIVSLEIALMRHLL